MLTIALAGLGTVGSGVVRMLSQNADLITSRAGKPIVIKAVSARDKDKNRSWILRVLSGWKIHENSRTCLI